MVPNTQCRQTATICWLGYLKTFQNLCSSALPCLGPTAERLWQHSWPHPNCQGFRSRNPPLNIHFCSPHIRLVFYKVLKIDFCCYGNYHCKTSSHVTSHPSFLTDFLCAFKTWLYLRTYFQRQTLELMCCVSNSAFGACLSVQQPRPVICTSTPRIPSLRKAEISIDGPVIRTSRYQTNLASFRTDKESSGRNFRSLSRYFLEWELSEGRRLLFACGWERLQHFQQSVYAAIPFRRLRPGISSFVRLKTRSITLQSYWVSNHQAKMFSKGCNNYSWM